MFDPKILYSSLKSLTAVNTLWIAYSGGLDSHVLLHAVACYSGQWDFPVRVVHVNHGLSPHADNWARHCLQTCHDLQLNCEVLTVQAQSQTGESPEACARDARYAALASLISPNDYVLTAHHQDDQAETLLLQLFRGAGPKGLAAMPISSQFAAGFLYRPLLGVKRTELANYAQLHNLKWIEDESNDHLKYDRNYVRHQLMPVIQARWPNAVATLSRSAKHCAEVDQLLADVTAIELTTLWGSLPNTLSRKKLLELNAAQQRQILRHWLQQLNLVLPSTTQLLQIQKDVLASRDDAQPEFKWQGTILRRHVDDIYASQDDETHDDSLVIPWNLQEPLRLPGKLGWLSAEQTRGSGICCAAIQNLTVRFRQGGERYHPRGRSGSHPLKKLFQEWRVPPWLRQSIPLLYFNKELIAVIGYEVSAAYAAKENELGWMVNLNTNDFSFFSSLGLYS